MIKSKKKSVPAIPEKCNIKELATLYAQKKGCNQKAAEEDMHMAIECITDALKAGSTVSVVGVMTLEVKTRAERQGRNPKTKEAITIPASKVVHLKVGKTLKDALNG